MSFTWLEAPVLSTGMPQRAAVLVQQGLMLAGLGNPLCFLFLECIYLKLLTPWKCPRLYFTGKDRMVTGGQCKYLTMTFPHIDLIDFHLIHPHIRDRKSSNED